MVVSKKKTVVADVMRVITAILTVVMVVYLIGDAKNVRKARLAEQVAEQVEQAQLQTQNELLRAELAATKETLDTYRQTMDATASLMGQAADTLAAVVYGPYSRQEVQTYITEIADILREVQEALTPEQVDEISLAIVTNAAAAEIDPMLLLSVAVTESNCRPWARGGSGEYGMMQVMPGTGKWIAGCLGYDADWQPADMLDAKQNIQFGAYYLRVVTNEFGGSMDKGLLAYNRGSGGARKWLSSHSAGSHGYVSRVQKNYSRYGGSGR